MANVLKLVRVHHLSFGHLAIANVGDALGAAPTCLGLRCVRPLLSALLKPFLLRGLPSPVLLDEQQ